MKWYFFLFWVISLLLYFVTPALYSMTFCQSLSFIFIANSLPFIIIKSKIFGFFNFYTLFFLSAFLVNFLHAGYAFPYENLFRAYRDYSYDSKLINESVAFVQVCMSSFILFNYSSHSKDIFKAPKFDMDMDAYVCKMEMMSLILTILFFMYSVFFLGDSLGSSYNMEGFSPRVNLVIQAGIVIPCYFIFADRKTCLKTISQIILEHKKLVLSSLLFMIALLIRGSRVNTLTLLMAICFLYNIYYKRISFICCLALFVVGILIFSLITITRVSDVNLASSSFIDVIQYGYEVVLERESIYVLFTDMIVNARNLYDGYGYSSDNNLLYGLSYFPVILGFVPFLGVFVLNLVGYNWEDVNTSMIMTDLNGASFGLGTNLVGDLCINFNHFGAFLFFIISGCLMSKLEKKKSVVTSILFLALNTFSFYIVRAAAIGYWLDFFYMLCLVLLLYSLWFRKNLFKISNK